MTMYAKIIRITLWALLPFLFASHTGLEPRPLHTVPQGAYELRSGDGAGVRALGNARYELAPRFSPKEGQYSVLRVQLENMSGGPHAMELMICLKETNGKPLKGTFGIARDIDGFSDYFEGVFGVADGSIFGEQLFFAQAGNLTIYHTDGAVLSGTMDMMFGNSDGGTVEVKGDFSATGHD